MQIIRVVPPAGNCHTDSDSFADSDDDFSDDPETFTIGSSQNEKRTRILKHIDNEISAQKSSTKLDRNVKTQTCNTFNANAISKGVTIQKSFADNTRSYLPFLPHNYVRVINHHAQVKSTQAKASQSWVHERHLVFSAFCYRDEHSGKQRKMKRALCNSSIPGNDSVVLGRSWSKIASLKEPSGLAFHILKFASNKRSRPAANEMKFKVRYGTAKAGFIQAQHNDNKPRITGAASVLNYSIKKEALPRLDNPTLDGRQFLRRKDGFSASLMEQFLRMRWVVTASLFDVDLIHVQQ